MNDEPLKPQTTLRDYVIKRVLGRGAFGVTYLAEDAGRHVAVAIKEYFPHHLARRADDGSSVDSTRFGAGGEDFHEGLEKFLEEARTLAGFESPHIVRVVDTFEYNGTAYMVMQYEEGGTLARYLLSHQEPLKEAQLLSIFIPLLEGLRTIHARWLLHRDIKPDNIYIRKDGSPLLIDFGTARHALSAKQGGMTEYLTPGYAPPEQYDRHADHGPWTDIYAVGASMYYCMTRITPYEGRFRTPDKDPVVSATQAAPAMYRRELLEIIDWMMNPGHQKRPQSVEEVLLRLMRLRDEEPESVANAEASLARNMTQVVDEKRAATPDETPIDARTKRKEAKRTKPRKPEPVLAEPAAGRPPTADVPELRPASTEVDAGGQLSQIRKPPWTVIVSAAMALLVIAVAAIWLVPSDSERTVEPGSIAAPDAGGESQPIAKPKDTKVEPRAIAKPEAETEPQSVAQPEAEAGPEPQSIAQPEPEEDQAPVADVKLIREAQTLLKKLELYAGEVDGVDGSDTRQAVALAQKELGVTQDGEVSRQLVSGLQTLLEQQPVPETQAKAQEDRVPQSGQTADSQAGVQDESESGQEPRTQAEARAEPDSIKPEPDSQAKAPTEPGPGTQTASRAPEEAAAADEKADDEWMQALEADSPNAYRQFLSEYPDSRYTKLAKIKLEILERDLWKQASKKDTKDAYMEFAAMFPDSRFASLARLRAGKL